MICSPNDILNKVLMKKNDDHNDTGAQDEKRES